MDSAESTEAAKALSNLAALLYERESFDDIAMAVCLSATSLIPECDHASLMMRVNGRYVTVAASDEVASKIDQLERELCEGPCVDAIEDESAQVERDLSRPSQWPALAKAVIESTDVRAAMAFRIRTGTAKTGALNMFSDKPGAFGSDAVDQAVIVAAFASVLVTARVHEEQVETLRTGLTTSREISKAVGLLMAMHKISDVEAFGLLKNASQRANAKLATLARKLVDKHHGDLVDP